jgi:hypothetical protein
VRRAIIRPYPAAFLLVFTAIVAARAQVPTGAIAGIATDSSGAVVSAATVSVANRDTGQTRSTITSADGRYSAEALIPGIYQVVTELAGFKRLARTANVEAGTTTTVDLPLEAGEVSETVSVAAAAPLLHRDQYQVGGVVSRAQIENLPLNGRNFLELAKLEPGVTNPARLIDNRTFVSVLGAGLQTIPRVGYTQVTVDGASITTPATMGTLLQVSQDAVEEFQLSTANFDPATGLTTNGAINIVTRSGGNDYQGSGFSFYRDHNLAAYPALRRDPANPDPFFRRNQFGGSLGGPIRPNRAFVFASYERNDQRGVLSVQPGTADLAPLGGIFPSPYRGNLLTTRADVQISRNHHAFARYTHDGNQAFAPVGAANSLPSSWSRRVVRADQGLAAVTSVLSAHLVNDVRLSHFVVSTPDHPAGPEDCANCFGLGAPQLTFTGGELTLGNPRTLDFTARRSQLTDSLVWQKDHHRLRFGFAWDHTNATPSSAIQEPAQLTLWSPQQVRQLNPTIQLPSSFTTLDDLLQLPLRSFQTGVGSGAFPQRNFHSYRVQNLYRLYASDSWTIGSRLTLDAGLAWSYEPNALNNDLTKPALLTPLVGAGRLNGPTAHLDNFSPTLGFAWTATRDSKTVVRGGAGRYFDPAASSNALNMNTERLFLSPLGTGRLIVSGSNIVWDGRALDFRQPTAFTGAQLLAILPAIRADLLRRVNPDNQDFSIRNIDSTKEGSNLYDPSYSVPSAIHVNLGVERELAPGLIIGADIVWRRFVNTFINGIDYNRFNSAAGPVIPACSEAQRNDVHAVCSNGNIFFDTTIGRARYKGLLARVEKRFTGRAQFLASYALSSFVGSNGTGTGTTEIPGGRVFGFNNDNWFENYGPLPTDQRHVLNFSGFVDLPWRFQVAISAWAYSRPPFSAYLSGVDFNGDGTVNDLLPGTTINQFGRGLDRDDLARLVSAYNDQYANRTTAGGQKAPPVTLPDNYAFDDNSFTLDLRLTRTMLVGGTRMRLLLFAEVFNLLNAANLVQYSGNLANPATFGQPGGRVGQVFGSGGPRAVQVGARLNF